MTVQMYGQMNVCTDSHVTTKIFEIDGLPNFLRYGAPLTHLWSTGAPLLTFEQLFEKLHAAHFLGNLKQLVESPKIISILWISTLI